MWYVVLVSSNSVFHLVLDQTLSLLLRTSAWFEGEISVVFYLTCPILTRIWDSQYGHIIWGQRRGCDSAAVAKALIFTWSRLLSLWRNTIAYWGRRCLALLCPALLTSTRARLLFTLLQHIPLCLSQFQVFFYHFQICLVLLVRHLYHAPTLLNRKCGVVFWWWFWLLWLRDYWLELLGAWWLECFLFVNASLQIVRPNLVDSINLNLFVSPLIYLVFLVKPDADLCFSMLGMLFHQWFVQLVRTIIACFWTWVLRLSNCGEQYSRYGIPW